MSRLDQDQVEMDYQNGYGNSAGVGYGGSSGDYYEGRGPNEASRNYQGEMVDFSKYSSKTGLKLLLIKALIY